MKKTTLCLQGTKSQLSLILILFGFLLTSGLTSSARELSPANPQNADSIIIYGNDAGISAFISPVNMDCVGNYPIVVELKNFGTNTLTSAKINWTINAMPQAQYSWTGNLATGETVQVTLYPMMSFYTFNYTITASAELPNDWTDEYTNNNQKTFHGHFLDGPLLNLNIANQATIIGGSAEFHVLCNSPATFTWQVSPAPYTSWTDLTADLLHYPGGIHNDTLWVSDVVPSMNNTKYRCSAELCGNALFSIAALLQVREPVYIRLDTITSGTGNEITFSCKVKNFTDLGSVSLWFYYKNAAMTYQSFPYVCPGAFINYDLITSPPGWGGIGFAWFSLIPVTLADETMLFQVKFSYISDSSILQWDSWTEGNCELADMAGTSIPIVLQNGYALNAAYGINPNLDGTLTYDNNTATPLANTAVMLKQGSITMNTGITDAAGHFVFNDLPNNWYTFDAACSKLWGGVNASDALLILKQFVGFVQLTGLKLVAADVDRSGFINAGDALWVAKRYTGIITSFPSCSGPYCDWVFQRDTVFLNGGTNVIQNFKGIVYGDVNGSYSPPTKEAPSVFMNLVGEISAIPGQTIQVPVYCQGDVSVGAVSLVVHLPEAINKIEKVIFPKDLETSGNLLFNVVDRQLFISWYSLSPLNLKSGDELLQISLQINQVITTEDLSLSLDPNSILADEDAVTLDNVLLSSPKLILANQGFWLGQNSPNPFKGATEFTYNVPEDALISLRIYNVTGECLDMQSMQVQAGTHTYFIDSKSFSPGIYFYKLEAKGNSQVYSGQRRMVVVD